MELRALRLSLAISLDLILVFGACGAFGQGIQERPKATLQAPPEQSGVNIIRDPLNRPCLEYEAIARPHVVNPTVFDHLVSVKNNCPRQIKVKICYYGSEKCNEIRVAGYARQDAILGTMTGVRYFRYVLSRQE